VLQTTLNTVSLQSINIIIQQTLVINSNVVIFMLGSIQAINNRKLSQLNTLQLEQWVKNTLWYNSLSYLY